MVFRQLLQAYNKGDRNFSKRSLREVILHNTSLVGINFSRCDLSSADFTNTDLSRANLSEANLTDADLTGTNLSGANLQSTNFIGGRLTRS